VSVYIRKNDEERIFALLLRIFILHCLDCPCIFASWFNHNRIDKSYCKAEAWKSTYYCSQLFLLM